MNAPGTIGESIEVHADIYQLMIEQMRLTGWSAKELMDSMSATEKYKRMLAKLVKERPLCEITVPLLEPFYHLPLSKEAEDLYLFIENLILEAMADC